MLSLKNFYYLLIFVSFLVLLINRKRLPYNLIWILALLPLSLFSQIIEDIMDKFGINSRYLFHIYTWVECIFLSIFYYSLLKSQLLKKIVLACTLFYIVFILTYFYTSKEILGQTNYLDFTVQCLITCIYVVLLFLEMLKVNYKINLRYYTAFWINASHLIFYGGTLFVMGFYYYLIQSNFDLAKQFIRINHFLNLFLYSAYINIFIWTAVPKTSSSSS